MKHQTFDNYNNLQKIANNKSKVSFIIQTDRLGSLLFCVKLEHEYFSPRSEKRNSLFEFSIVSWPLNILRWFVVTIPKEDYNLAEIVANETGMKIAPTIPLMIYDGKEEIFPMKGDNVYSVENNSKSIIYTNDIKLIEERKEAEKIECDKIIKKCDDEIEQLGMSDY